MERDKNLSSETYGPSHIGFTLDEGVITPTITVVSFILETDLLGKESSIGEKGSMESTGDTLYTFRETFVSFECRTETNS